MIDYLKNTLKERKSLADQLEKAQQEKDAQGQEFKKKTKLLSDFPAMLQKLEEASLPLQDYLSVTITRDEQLRKTVARLPTALATLFEKLTVFAEQYPQFNLSVKVGGDSSLADHFYQTYDEQLMFNPWRSSRKVKPAAPGISAHSKQISKRNKKAAKILEEGEAEDSDEDNE